MLMPRSWPPRTATWTPSETQIRRSRSSASSELEISIESLNARYRRAATACGHFPNEQAALKRIYLATLALDPSGRGRKRWNNKWKAALNEFDQLFDGRLTAGRV
jgi:transposase-like protein